MKFINEQKAIEFKIKEINRLEKDYSYPLLDKSEKFKKIFNELKLKLETTYTENSSC